LTSVELVDEYPGMIRITAHDGSRWHYLPDNRGNLELGRPLIMVGHGYQIHVFVQLGPYVSPRLLKVEPLE
jgi:hypothetical protein